MTASPYRTQDNAKWQGHLAAVYVSPVDRWITWSGAVVLLAIGLGLGFAMTLALGMTLGLVAPRLAMVLGFLPPAAWIALRGEHFRRRVSEEIAANDTVFSRGLCRIGARTFRVVGASYRFPHLVLATPLGGEVAVRVELETAVDITQSLRVRDRGVRTVFLVGPITSITGYAPIIALAVVGTTCGLILFGGSNLATYAQVGFGLFFALSWAVTILAAFERRFVVSDSGVEVWWLRKEKEWRFEEIESVALEGVMLTLRLKLEPSSSFRLSILRSLGTTSSEVIANAIADARNPVMVAAARTSIAAKSSAGP